MSYSPINPAHFEAHWNNGAYKAMTSDDKSKRYWAPGKVTKYKHLRAGLGSPSLATALKHRVTKPNTRPEARQRTTPVTNNLCIDTPKRFSMGSGTPATSSQRPEALQRTKSTDGKRKLCDARKTLKASMLDRMGTGKLNTVAHSHMFDKVKTLGILNEDGSINRRIPPAPADPLSLAEIEEMRAELEIGPSPLREVQTVVVVETDRARDGAVMDARCRRIVEKTWELARGA